MQREQWLEEERQWQECDEGWKWSEGWKWEEGWKWDANWWEDAGWSDQHAEPTASWNPQASQAAASSHDFPLRDPDEDKYWLRNATLTPASFMPQRLVTMALGRPVVVLRG